MNLDRRPAIAALTAAGLLWGTTIPLTKLGLEWLPPGWLTVVRFALAAAVLLVTVRSRVRAACTPAVLVWGALGYGGSIMIQNAGIERTSVSHAALLVGATPVLVAIVAAVWHRSVASPRAWAGYAVSLTGVGLVAGGGGGSATITGDGLVLASLLLSAGFLAAQSRLLDGHDPVAVSAMQFLAASIAGVPVAMITDGLPPAPASSSQLLTIVGLALGGTLLPFTLFAYGQARVSAEVAGAFINLEPLVGAATGALLFGDPVGLPQAIGGATILTGIALSSLRQRRRTPARNHPPRSPQTATAPDTDQAAHTAPTAPRLPSIRNASLAKVPHDPAVVGAAGTAMPMVQGRRRSAGYPQPAAEPRSTVEQPPSVGG